MWALCLYLVIWGEGREVEPISRRGLERRFFQSFFKIKAFSLSCHVLDLVTKKRYIFFFLGGGKPCIVFYVPSNTAKYIGQKVLSAPTCSVKRHRPWKIPIHNGKLFVPIVHYIYLSIIPLLI
jgi:hypothetical protein